MTETLIALDRASVRRSDKDDHLHVARTPISKANVCPYQGREIPKWQSLGLNPDTVYHLYRDPAELKKAAPSFNGKPLLLGHKPVSADDHPHEMVVGGVNNVEWEEPLLYAALDIWDGKAIAEIESGRQEQLSAAYRYTAVMEPGTAPDGSRYDGRMVNIDGNHVAIVPEGRAGPDMVVLDASLIIKQDWVTMSGKTTLSRPAKLAGLALDAHLKPRLASGVALDGVSFFVGVKDAKTFRSQLPAIVTAIKARTAGKLAQDASVDDVQEVMEAIAPILEAEPGLMDETGAVDAGDLSDEEEAQYQALLKRRKLDAAVDEKDDDKGEKKAEDEKDDKAMDAKIVAAVKAATKGLVPQVSLDAALKAQKAEGIAIREAADFVEPWAGKVSVALDSVEAIHRAALDVLGVDHADVPAGALKHVIMVQPKPGEAKRPSPRVGMDSAAIKGFAERFPEAAHIRQL